jgi:hypothetical protein
MCPPYSRGAQGALWVPRDCPFRAGKGWPLSRVGSGGACLTFPIRMDTLFKPAAIYPIYGPAHRRRTSGIRLQVN